MKTQNKKLDFKKNSLVELNDSQLKGVNGGSSWVCSIIVVVSLLSPPAAGSSLEDSIFENDFE